LNICCWPGLMVVLHTLTFWQSPINQRAHVRNRRFIYWQWQLFVCIQLCAEIKLWGIIYWYRSLWVVRNTCWTKIVSNKITRLIELCSGSWFCCGSLWMFFFFSPFTEVQFITINKLKRKYMNLWNPIQMSVTKF
jgi:hypothetical protein